MRCAAIIPAGGTGSRSGYSLPKQFLKIHGKELIIYTLEIFERSSLVHSVTVAVHPDYNRLMKRLAEKYKLKKLNNIVDGGSERQDSVFNALSSLSLHNNDLIAVHDAARPLLPIKTLNNAINLANKNGNALVCIKASDTLIKTKKSNLEYLDRDSIFYVQTPQIFRYDDLFKAMKLAYNKKFKGTDESSIMNFAGHKINLAEGSLLNFKVTTPEDILLFKKLAAINSKQ